MSMQHDDETEQALEQAVGARLARLRKIPVDTTALDKAVRARVPQVRAPRILLMRPLRAIAASFLIVAGVVTAVVLSTSSGPALASAAQMAQVHQDIVSGRIPVMQVDSIEAANRMLNSQSPDAPALPQVPQSHVMACCMKSVHNKKMACVLLRDDGEPITLAVASASDMKLGPALMATRNGVSYRVESVGNLHMVMTERDGRWLCLISQLPADRLMDVSGRVRF